MSTVLPHPDQRTIDRLRAGDESALEQLFRDSFPALREEAATALGDEAFAPRIVERAMLDTWSARETVSTPEALESLLHAAVHDESLRERSRRAAIRRFEMHDGHVPGARRPHPHALPENADEAWRELSVALHAGEGHEAAHKRQMEQGRHDLAVHIEHVGDDPGWRPFLIWTTIGTLALFGAYALARPWLQEMNEPTRVARAVASKDAGVLAARSGSRALVTLRDGSEASLAPDSRLRVAPGFLGDRRWIGLEGSIRMNVAASAEGEPLVVTAGPALVHATGIFDVAAWPGEAVVVRSQSGSTTVRADGEVQPLQPGEALLVRRDGTTIIPDKATLDAALGWIDGTLAVRDRPFADFVTLLERWYAVQLRVDDPALLERRVTLSAPLDDPPAVYAALERNAGIRVMRGADGARVAVGTAGAGR